MGLPLFPRMLVGRAGYRERQRITFAGAAFLLLLFAVGRSVGWLICQDPSAIAWMKGGLVVKNLSYVKQLYS